MAGVELDEPLLQDFGVLGGPPSAPSPASPPARLLRRGKRARTNTHTTSSGQVIRLQQFGDSLRQAPAAGLEVGEVEDTALHGGAHGGGSGGAWPPPPLLGEVTALPGSAGSLDADLDTEAARVSTLLAQARRRRHSGAKGSGGSSSGGSGASLMSRGSRPHEVLLQRPSSEAAVSAISAASSHRDQFGGIPLRHEVSRPSLGPAGRYRDCGVQTEEWRVLSAAPPLAPPHSNLRARFGSRRWHRDPSDAASPPPSRGSIASRDDTYKHRMRTLNSAQVRPGLLELDAPRRLHERENDRRNLGRVALWWHDLKTWVHLQRTKRRDPTPLWRKKIKVVEGYFGSGVASFFVFVRWVFLLNLVQMAFWFFPVILPTVIRFEYSRIKSGFSALNLLDGQGAVGESYVFFGGYSEVAGSSYRIDLAYVLVIITLYIGCFWAIVRNIALSSNTNSASLVKMDKSKPFSIVVLASWDHSINQSSGVSNLRSGIASAIKDLFGQERLQKWNGGLHDGQSRIKIRLMRAFAWFVWLAVMCGSFAAVWFLLLYQDSHPNSQISSFAASGTFAVINGLAPFLLKKLGRREGRHKKLEIRITIMRTFVVRLIALYALLYGLYRRTRLDREQEPVFVVGGPEVDQEFCAGTVIGQELFKTIVVDALFSLSSRAAVNIGWYHLYNQKLELDMAQGVMALVYRQGLIWAAMVFSPFAPVVGLLTNTLFFYVYYILVLKTCRPPAHRWSQSRHSASFMTFLILALIAVFVPISYALQMYKPNCGPYGAPRYDSMYDALTEWKKEQSYAMQKGLRVVSSGAFLVPVILCLLAAVNYFISEAKKLRREAEEAQEELRSLLEQRKAMFSPTTAFDEL